MPAKWSQGYVTDIPYTKSAFNVLSPQNIDYALTLSGQSPSCMGGGVFTYAELGAGFGLSISGWAAMFPQSEFYAVDFNPTQTAWLARLKDAAALDNLHVYERSFHQALDEELPLMDYIVIHGIVSWVTPEVRADIREFIVKFLKPGGVVYLGYNVQPGWTTAEPLRQMLLAHMELSGEHDCAKKLGDALAMLTGLQQAGAAYFKTSSRADLWLKSWQERYATGRDGVAYLIGELASVEHKAFYFSEMVADMAEAKTVYADSLNMEDHLEQLLTPAPFRERLAAFDDDPAMRGTVKDFLYNNTFRRDLFVKGRQPLERARRRDRLAATRLVLTRQRPALDSQTVLKGVAVTLRPDIFTPLLDLLEGGAATLGELTERSGLALNQVTEAATVMLALEWLAVAPPVPAEAERVRRYNLALDDLLGSEQSLQMLTPLGGWVGVGAFERLHMLARLRGLDPVAHIAATVRDRNLVVHDRDGHPVAGDGLEAFLAEQTASLSRQIEPIFARLGLESK